MTPEPAVTSESPTGVEAVTETLARLADLRDSGANLGRGLRGQEAGPARPAIAAGRMVQVGAIARGRISSPDGAYKSPVDSEDVNELPFPGRHVTVLRAPARHRCGRQCPGRPEPAPVAGRCTATSTATSFHFLATADGTLNLGQLMGNTPLPITGTKAEGDVSVNPQAAQLTFTVPLGSAAIAISGGLIYPNDGSVYIKLALPMASADDLWHKMSAGRHARPPAALGIARAGHAGHGHPDPAGVDRVRRRADQRG